MRRYQLVLGGTAAGVAAVLAFPLRSSRLVVPGGSSTTALGGSIRSSSTSPLKAPTIAPSGAGAGAGDDGGGDDGGGDDGATPSSSSITTSPSTSNAPVTRTAGGGTATGATASYPYGQLSVRVSVQGKKITKVTMASMQETDGHSVAIDHYAVPQLERQVLSADSANIQGVSGATFTSQAFVDSLVSALNKLGFK